MELIALSEHLEHLDACRNDHRRQGVGEEVRTGTLAKHVDDLFAAGRESAHCASESFPEGSGEDVDTAIATKLLGDAASGLSDDTGAVALVHHDKSVIFLGQIADLVHRGDISVHREDTVGADDPKPLGLGLLEAALKVFHVSVGVTVAYSFAQADSVDDGGVVEGVGDDRVLGCQKRFEDTSVGVEAGSVEDGVLSLEKV